jgi:negative regulator of flagellin synthesis FlgM
MDITNIHQRDPYAIAQNAQTERSESAKVTGGPQSQAALAPRADKVSVSETGVLRTEAYRTAMNTPEIRQEKVDNLKAQVDSGNYQIDPQRIARAMVEQEANMLA